jgi:hypothetical protein
LDLTQTRSRALRNPLSIAWATIGWIDAALAQKLPPTLA